MHRDIKPENILVNLGDFGVIKSLKLADFGLACYFDDKSIESKVFGSQGYKAPEGIMGEENINHKVDSWSLGIVLSNLVCGKMPFRGTENKLKRNVLTK